MRKKISILGIIATLALVLSGCMRMHINLAITENDTVNGEIIMAFEDEAIRSMGMEPSEAWDSMGGDSMLESFPTDQGTVEDYAEDGYTGKRIVLNEAPISAFAGGSQDGSLSITREGDEFVVTGKLDLTDDSGASDSIPSYLLDSFDIRVTVAFPGKVTESSGEINGNQTTWIATYGEVTDISARGGAAGSGSLTSPSPTATSSPTPTETESESPSTTPSESATADSDDEDEDVAADSDDNGTNWLLWGGIAAGALALIALITIFIATGRKKDGDPDDPNYPDGGQGGYPGQPGTYPGHPGPIAPAVPGGYPGQPTQDYPTQQLPPQQYPTQQLPPVGQPGQYPPQQQPPVGQGPHSAPVAPPTQTPAPSAPPAPSGPPVPGQDPTQQLPPTPPTSPAPPAPPEQ